MKVRFLFFIGLLIASACSSPKYTASFKSYNQSPQYSVSQKGTSTIASGELPTSQEIVLASTSKAPVETPVTKPIESSSYQSKKIERKEAVKQLKHDLKAYVKQQKQMVREGTYQSIEWDNDLKLATIFGAAGLVGVLLGGISVVFSIIGGIALIIAVIFFVQWVIRQ